LSKRLIDGSDFMDMVFAGAELLQEKAADINALNVFPVPDGDTGTNMNLTLSSGVEQLRRKPSDHIGKAAEALSKGLLMGARGNSGVILSQLFRGFAKSVAAYEQVNPQQFAAALQEGVDMAYKAVVKPVEGTILTVAKEAARHAVIHARRSEGLPELMREVLRQAREALAKTPDLLPILKQVGVVDSGGQGLVFVYEGFFTVLSGQGAPAAARKDTELSHDLRPASAQAQIATEDIEYLYDMEFFILLSPGSKHSLSFNEAHFRKQLGKDGDSILVIVDNDVVKVHVHSKEPGDVLNLALKHGELSRINIQNMRDQHRDLLGKEAAEDIQSVSQMKDRAPVKPYGIIAVAAGEGITDIFNSLGVDIVLSGGQTMNPSTEDIVNAIERVNAEHIYVLPNNSNIILAAGQAAELVEQSVYVIPTKTIPQGMAAVLAFRDNASMEHNANAMKEAAARIRSGQITPAVRDSTIDGFSINENDMLGILDNKIIAANPDLMSTCKQLLTRMIQDGDEILTILTGEEASAQFTGELLKYVESEYPDLETEIHSGDQPVYHYIFSVE
jgi:DAK2 domain fusion protein YloV